MKILRLFPLVFLTLKSIAIIAQSNLPFDELGRIITLSANEIETSRWSVGGETLDRDYANYHEYKSFLGPSGAKRIRLQAGWAKCEQVKGEYDFTWLDAIIDDAISQGVSPWVQASYGNPIYEGGGQPFLAGGIPTSEEALEAWDNWVSALVTRYKNKVNEWEIWNEADISKQMTAREFAVFHLRTCEIVKKVQPEARIIALGLAGLGRIEYVTSIMDLLKAENKLHFMDVLSYHGYSSRPEQTYPQIQKLREIIDEYKPGIEMWQGENGTPSTPEGESVGALSREDWSEITQAKWILRRMMGDIGHDVDVVNIFTLSDIWYQGGDHLVGYNSKGLLKARPDHSIDRPKHSYFAYQYAATLFSGNIDRIKCAKIETDDSNLMVFAFSKVKTEGSALVFWFAEAKPVDEYVAKPVNISASGINMKEPVLVDLFSGIVYQAPKANMKIERDKIVLNEIPVADYPLVLVESAWLKIE
jgi:polysaccharide biosynthesis protein PslG